MLKTVPVKNLKPNPFRRLDEYPIIREKVDALKESISSTGFWGTIVGREVGDIIQIAFGHHRLVALQETGTNKAEIIVRDLSNEDMLKMMARENMEEWGTSAWVEVETVRATIEAYGRGEIELPSVGKRGPRRETFHGSGKFYTHATIAEFLGWTRKANKGEVKPNYACETAFLALEMIDNGFLSEGDIRGLNRSGMAELIREHQSIYQSEQKTAEANRKEADEAKKRAALAPSNTEKSKLSRQAEILERQAEQHESAAKQKSTQFVQQTVEKVRTGQIGIRGIRAEADAYKAPTQKPAQLVDVDGYARKNVIPFLADVMRDESQSKLVQDIKFLDEYRKDLSPEIVRELCQQFDALIGRVSELSAPFRSNN